VATQRIAADDPLALNEVTAVNEHTYRVVEAATDLVTSTYR
jgi:hypothetical protein